jgi:hypothetical protein
MNKNLRHVLLQFDPTLSQTTNGKEERGDLSVVVETPCGWRPTKPCD